MKVTACRDTLTLKELARDAFPWNDASQFRSLRSRSNRLKSSPTPRVYPQIQKDDRQICETCRSLVRSCLSGEVNTHLDTQAPIQTARVLSVWNDSLKMCAIWLDVLHLYVLHLGMQNRSTRTEYFLQALAQTVLMRIL